MPDTASGSIKPPETILVVEDEVLIRLVIAAYLRECGFRVIEAVSADEAIVVLQEPETDVEVVFSDVEMPGSLDGFGLMRWVREHRPELPVVLTGTPARATEAAADLCKSGPHLAKPYAPHLVLDHIRRLLAQRRNGRQASPSFASTNGASGLLPGA